MAWHLAKNAFLLVLSLVFMPFSSPIVLLLFLGNKLGVGAGKSTFEQCDSSKTVLITGLSMSKGLTLARLFHRRGHRVIGADCHRFALGRVSAACDKFYHLPSLATDGSKSYITRLFEIAKNESVDLWISVSDVNAAIEDAQAKDLIERHTKTEVVQFSESDINVLNDKSSFIQCVRDLELDTPDTEIVENKASILDFLRKRKATTHLPGRSRYLVKPIGVNDAVRFDMPIVPSSTEEETFRTIQQVTTMTGDQASFIVQELIEGPEFCTHALIIQGAVRAFVACPSASVLMHYSPLPKDSALSRKMLEFTTAVASSRGPHFTGHLSFDFLVKTSDTESKEPSDVSIYPIECNPRVHTAIVLFNNTPDLVDEYLSLLDDRSLGEHALLTPRSSQNYYWIGQDLVEEVIYPTYQALVSGDVSSHQLGHCYANFYDHLRYWKDGTFETWDPLPWWVLYHLHWPLVFAKFMFKGRWQKVNVSTGKIFKM